MSPDTLSRVFAALADPTRRDIVDRLAADEATVNQLAEPYRMSVQAVYKHLRVLEEAGLVSRAPGPQPRRVRLRAEALDLMDEWLERYRRRAEERYQRLDRVLATMRQTNESEENSDDDDRGGPDGPHHPHHP
ncbi:MAG TPA: metalloregulator ArsR/SmtB family transcription factor [Pilimelia sp.]|nr:metalloregulator ArsR/SmtB family transcription factor [Pilimelia sp.]